MADFKFIYDIGCKDWVILAPQRAKRPDEAVNTLPTVCPFCPGSGEEELYRRGGEHGDNNWSVRVLRNKFPFAPIHEVIVHSQDHHKNFDELPLSQVVEVIKVYQQRTNLHKDVGHTYIFQNHGEASGESIPHPHSQLVVIPKSVVIPSKYILPKNTIVQKTDYFTIFCPITSQWPDEVWVAPQNTSKTFGNITEEEITDLAFILQRIIVILDSRHGSEFPFNFYIMPGDNWYLRIIPRLKKPGGFELATNIYVNTQNPEETITCIKEHFFDFDKNKIKEKHSADYKRGV